MGLRLKGDEAMKVYIKADLLIYDGTNFDDIVTQLADVFDLYKEDLGAEHNEKGMAFTFGENDIDMEIGDGILILPELGIMCGVLKTSDHEVLKKRVLSNE